MRSFRIRQSAKNTTALVHPGSSTSAVVGGQRILIGVSGLPARVASRIPAPSLRRSSSKCSVVWVEMLADLVVFLISSKPFLEIWEGAAGSRTRSGRSGSKAQSRGSDAEQVVEVSLEDAYRGASLNLQWEGGRKIEARIPPGVKTGSKIRLSGQGQPGFGGGQAGDLYLKVDVRQHSLFNRDGDDLKVKVPVDLYTAVLGGKVSVPTLDRPVELTVPPGTSNGKTFRLHGLGMPHLKNPQERGNLYATVDIQLPTNLSPQERELFEKLRAIRK